MFRRLLMAGATVLPLLAAPGARADEKILRVAPSADLTLLDPMFASIVITRIYALEVYDMLFSWDSKLEPKPQMVSQWSTSPGGLTWTFTLRDGLKFSTGEDVTTTDVAASLTRWMKRDVIGQKLGSAVVAVEPADAKTFRIRLKHPVGYMLYALGSAVGQIPVIMRAKDLEGDPAKPVTTAIGSGPFVLDRAKTVSGAKVVFNRNPYYVPRQEPPDGLAGGHIVKVDRMEWEIIPDPATAAAALRNGEVDIWEQPLLDLVPTLQADQNLRVKSLTSLSNQTMLRPNSLYPPFNDPRARLALAYLTNQSDVMEGGFGDKKWWRTCASYFVCSSPNGTEAGADAIRTPDVEKARKLLAEAGYHGEKLTMIATHEIAPIGQMTEVVADELKRAGVNVDVVWSDWGTVTTRQVNKSPPDRGGWNLFVTYASGPTMQSPLTNIGTNMSCDGRNWAGWPCDQEAEALRQAYIDATGDSARKAALVKLHERLVQVEPYRVLGQFDQPIAYRADVKGLLASPVVVYWNIEK